MKKYRRINKMMQQNQEYFAEIFDGSNEMIRKYGFVKDNGKVYDESTGISVIVSIGDYLVTDPDDVYWRMSPTIFVKKFEEMEA